MFGGSARHADLNYKGEIAMEDDGVLVSLHPMRELVTALVEVCEDTALLDLIYKLLLNT